MTPRLALGTVQFGTDYGINNKTGQVAEREAAAILSRAASAGIDTLDTSQAYGKSEEVLGGIPASASFRVVSKFIASPELSPRGLLSSSLKKLKRDRIYSFLYHRFSDLADYPDWHRQIAELKAEGLIAKTGFSVYYPREIETLLDKGVEFGLVQLPYNVFDRRFEPLFPALEKAGVEIHVRSVFLQGLVFMERSSLPPGLASMGPKVESLRRLALKAGVPVQALCLCFALARREVARAVVGVDGLHDLEDDLAGAAMTAETAKVLPELLELAENNEDLLLPFKWKK